MKTLDFKISDEHYSLLARKAEKQGKSVEDLLSKFVEILIAEPVDELRSNNLSCTKVFIDTSVLALIVGETALGKSLLKHLKESKIQLVTLSKCIYELYSIVKGTTKKPSDKHPLKNLLPKDINDIGQKLFKKTQIDLKANTFYWFNLCEEWTWPDHFNEYEDLIEQFCNGSGKQQARENIKLQEEFLDWKMSLKKVYSEIDDRVINHGIQVFYYHQIFRSDWYISEGFELEQLLAQDTLLPNEDFELVFAALAFGAKAFITRDDKDLILRGGLSLGLNLPNLSFCCPERIEDAIASNFQFRCYRMKDTRN